MLQQITNQQLRQTIDNWKNQGIDFQEVNPSSYTYYSLAGNQLNQAKKKVYYALSSDIDRKALFLAITQGNKIFSIENEGAFDVKIGQNGANISETFKVSSNVEQINSNYDVYLLSQPNTIGSNKRLSAFNNLVNYFAGKNVTLINIPQNPSLESGKVGLYALVDGNYKVNTVLIDGDRPRRIDFIEPNTSSYSVQ